MIMHIEDSHCGSYLTNISLSSIFAKPAKAKQKKKLEKEKNKLIIFY